LILHNLAGVNPSDLLQPVQSERNSQDAAGTSKQDGFELRAGQNGELGSTATPSMSEPPVQLELAQLEMLVFQVRPAQLHPNIKLPTAANLCPTAANRGTGGRWLLRSKGAAA
jgi:hypothetical protein